MRNKIILAAVLVVCCSSVVIASECESFPEISKHSHSNKYDPDYDVVFDKNKEAQDKVKRIEIKIASLDWDAMWSDLDDTFGDMMPQHGGEMGGMMPPMGGMMGEMPEGMLDSMMMMQRGGGMRGGGMRGGGMMPPMGGEMGEMPEGMEFHHDGMPEGGMKDPLSSVDISPMWVPCTITFNGEEWEQVGVRFKGNSSLMQSYMMGNEKLSMKLDFDHYEDDYPELKNQRFYGFKQFNLNNNYNDASFMREKVVSDLLREFGLVSAHTSFCEVYMDYGEGSKYLGLYTIIEEVDDTVVEDQFGDGSGNLYKPEERAGSFASGTFETSEFNIKSKADNPQYEDVKALYNVLNSEKRTLDEAAWCKSLESVFDIDTFLRWLAVNTSIQNWDTYGNMAHNYFLYNNPKNGKLTWISWDHNEALQGGRNVYEPSTLTRAGDSWPLITYLLGVEEYRVRFDGYLREFVENVFEPTKVSKMYDYYSKLLNDSANADQTGQGFMRGASSFDSAVEALKQHVVSRNRTILEYFD